jgi:hypothetical protein
MGDSVALQLREIAFCRVSSCGVQTVKACCFQTIHAVQRIIAGDASLKCHAVLIQQRLVIEAPAVVSCARDRTVVPLILLLGNCSSCANYDCDGYVVCVLLQCCVLVVACVRKTLTS